MGIIRVNNIRLFTNHGCLEEEAKIGSEYRVDIEVKANLQKAAKTDELVDTVDYVKDYFKHGYLMDPHTATCIKAYDNCRIKSLKTVVTSTAEWTKFSMTTAEAIGAEAGDGDLQALKNISVRAEIAIPEQIESLFSKPIIHDTLINKADIEKTILSFL